jgi:LacI family transcriptional regulator
LSESEILARLATTPISGIILDTLDESLLRLLEKSSACPLVMVNSWFEYASVNVVLQDNYKGGYLAARWLAEAGAERVAWLGPIGEFGHSRERFAGVVAGMASLKRRLSSEMAIEAPFLAMEESARALLARHDRPDGVVAFSKSAAQAIRNAAGAAGLKIGKDLLVVGWTVEDCFESEHYSVFAGGPIPPAIVWSAKEMAQAAMDVLLAPAPATGRRILVPTRLKLTH